MSRTACCFLALGISVAALAAACGDDDDGGGGIGGNGGNGASGGSGGSAGSAGSGNAGSAGSAGSGAGGTSGGTAGTGSGGTAGSSAGAAGSSAGAAGSAGAPSDGGVPDSGVVEEPDSGVAPPDAAPPTPGDGGVNGDCNFGAGAGSLVEQDTQQYVISKVIFEGTTAHVTLRTVTAAAFADPQQLCSGPTDAECVPVNDEINGDRPAGTELVVDITDVDAATGELAFLSDLPSNDPFAFAYVNWGEFDSVDPPGAPLSLEAIGVAGSGVLTPFWTDGDSITLGNGDNAFFADGDVTVEGGFSACTATTF